MAHGWMWLLETIGYCICISVGGIMYIDLQGYRYIFNVKQLKIFAIRRNSVHKQRI